MKPTALPRILLLSCWLALPLSTQAATPPPFPDPAQITQDYPDLSGRAVALVIMRDVLLASNARLPAPDSLSAAAVEGSRETWGGAGQAWRRAGIDAYNKALSEVQAEERRRGIELDSGGLTHEQRLMIYRGGSGSDSLSKARELHSGLYQRYLPSIAALEQQRPAGTPLSADEQRLLTAAAILIVTLLAMLATPWLLLRGKGRRPPATGPATADAEDPIALPEALRTLSLPKLRYQTRLLSGLVAGVDSWIDREDSTTVSGGRVTVQPGLSPHTPHLVNVEPTKVEVESKFTKKDRLWLVTTDGREIPYTFVDDEVKARPSQVVSVLGVQGQADDAPPLLVYNHTTRRLSTLGFRNLTNQHVLPGFGIWLATTLVGLAGSALVGTFVATPDAATRVTLVLAVVSAVIAGVYTGIIKLIYRTRRNSAFRRSYLLAFKQHFEQITPQLLMSFNLVQPAE